MPRGDQHPSWKGDDILPLSGRMRAVAAYRVLGTCEGCGAVPAVERHHKDRNPINNDRDNLAFYCIPCHKRAHLRDACPNGHPYTSDNTYRYRGYRLCRACRRERVREWRERRDRSVTQGGAP